MGFWHLWMGQEGGGTVTASPVITIEGRSLVADEKCTNVDSVRTIRTTLTPGDAADVYVFEETEVS